MDKKILDRITLALLILITLLILFFLTFNISAQEIKIKQAGKVLNVSIDCRNLTGKDLVMKIYINNIIVCALNRIINVYTKILESGREYEDKGTVNVFLYDKETGKILSQKNGIYK